MPIIELPNNVELEFPDSMPETEIKTAVEKYISSSSAKKVTPSTPKIEAPSTFEGLTDSVMRGFTLGVSDPVAAAGGAVGKLLTDLTLGRNLKDFGDYYSAQKTKIADKDAAFKESNPVTAYGSEIGASFLNPVAQLAGKYVGSAPTLVGRTLRGATSGAPLSATYAGATAKPENFVRDTSTGLGAGFLVGGLTVPVVEGAIGVGRGVLQKALDKYSGNVSQATQKIGEVIKDLGNGDMRRGLAIMRMKVKESGPDTALVDVLGIPGQRLARGSVNATPEAQQIGDNFVNMRVGSRGTRFQNAADSVNSDRGFYNTIDNISAQQKKLADPLYKEAFAPVSNKDGKIFAQWDDQLERLLSDPDIRTGMAKGIRNIQRDANADGTPFSFEEYAVKGFDDAGQIIIDGTPSLKAMDAAKRGLDDMIDEARDSFGNINWTQNLRSVDNLRRNLVKKLDQITTVDGRSAYKEARKAWSGPASLKDAAWQGRKFLKGDVEIVESGFNKLSPSEKSMFKLGMRRELSKLINSDTQSAATKFDPKKKDFWDRIKSVLEPDEFSNFKKAITSELDKAKVERFVNPKANSATGGIIEDVAELNRAPSAVINALDQASTGNKAGSLATLIKAPLNWLSRPNKTTARNLAEMLFESNPQAQSEIIGQLGARRLATDLAPWLSKSQGTKLANLLASRASPVSTVGE